MLKHAIFNLAIRIALWACKSGNTYDFLVEAKEQEDAYRRVYDD